MLSQQSAQSRVIESVVSITGLSAEEVELGSHELHPGNVLRIHPPCVCVCVRVISHISQRLCRGSLL